VAWADSATATSSVNGFVQSSSPLGSGLMARRRVKNSRILSRVILFFTVGASGVKVKSAIAVRMLQFNIANYAYRAFDKL
jgi:hypothetical protein